MSIMNLHLNIALPEIIVLVMTVITLLVDLFVPQKKHKLTFSLTLITLILAAASTLHLYNMPKTFAFNGMFVHDQMTSLLSLFIYLTGFFSFIYARSYIDDRNIHQGEYYILGLFSILGMIILVSANSLLVLFLGLELLSLPVYAMAALRRDSSTCSEAAMKYFIMGGIATGILLYGMSMIYGATGTLNIPRIAHIVSATPAQDQLILIFGLVFLLTGIFFKLGAAPFHMWVPDVYQGAPTPVTIFLGAGPKIAAFALAVRLLVDTLPTLDVQWQQVIIVIALLSMGLGNIVAIAQKNIKRMLAYSSVAHMGYMSLGLLAVSKTGYASAMFYIIIYVIMSMGAFAMVTLLSRKGFEAENISDFRGLNSRSPWLAFMMLLLMFSMAGIPPTVGFFAKLGVLEALVSAHFIWLAAIALIFAVIGSYYYLAVVKTMYFEEPDDHSPVVASMDMRIAITVNSLAVVALGLFPTALIDLCRQAFGI